MRATKLDTCDTEENKWSGKWEKTESEARRKVERGLADSEKEWGKRCSFIVETNFWIKQ